MLRPTKKAYYEFIHLLDKMLSDNLNKVFFKKAWLELTREETTKTWTYLRDKWTLQLLWERITTNTKNDNRIFLEKMNENLRDIRRLRQIPWHNAFKDEFDISYFSQQRELIFRAYMALKILRNIFKYHPKNEGYQIPFYLETGEYIIDY